MADFWLAHWSNNSGSDTEHGNGYYYGIYITLSMISIILLFGRMGMAVLGCIGVSVKLHTDMFGRIIRAPINLFFDRIPLGRLINRFAADLNIVDGLIPFSLSRISFLPFDLLLKFLVCGIFGTLWVFPLLFIFGWLCYRIQKRYFRVYRETFRLCKEKL